MRNRQSGQVPQRIENCFRLKARRAPEVSLRKKEGAARAHYGDLQTCGSVWACPCCSSIISERRCQHVQQSIDVWKGLDSCNVVCLFTFTTPHYIFQSLEDVLSVQDKAFRIMKQQPQRGSYKVYRTIMDEMMSLGAYTGREVTYGQNGWHPHRHDLHFTVRATLDQLASWREDLVTAFAIAFEKAGGHISNMDAFRQRSVRIDQIENDEGFTRVAHYITTVEGDSWTIAQEATKGVSKMAKNGNITPFGMLDAIRQGDENSGLYSAKFYEYTQTMKGKKQFFPTRGLNQFFGLHWKTDEELLQESETGQMYAMISDPDWMEINSLNLRGEVLELTRDNNDFEFIDQLDLLLSHNRRKDVI